MKFDIFLVCLFLAAFQVGQTAVPEPSTYTSLILAIGAAVVVARRYRVA